MIISKSASSPDKYPYRPDIDGLRAVAVSAVVIHHLNGELIPGGFVGVDIFFVISGFVVTQSILRTQSGNVLNDLLGFWRRRWLRIIPALLFMIMGTSLMFAAFFAPIPQETYNATLRTGFFSAFGLSNLYLLRLASDYFQSDQSINVFLHTWSLGVEEQFYVIFSLLVIAIPGYLFRHRNLQRVRLLLISGLFLASVWFFLELFKTKPMSAYYLLPARFWEMAIGSIIALSFGRLMAIRSPSWAVNVVQFFALGTLLYALFFYQDADLNFAIPIFLATGAATVFIVAGAVQHQGSANYLSTFLSQRLLVLIGLLSYSIYLWHWPVLILFRYTIGLDNALAVIGALGTVFLLSLFSYRFVEQRWRGSKTPFLKRLAPQFVLAFGSIFIVTAIPQAFPGMVYAGSSQVWNVDWRRDHDFAYGGEGKIRAFDCSLVAGSEIPDRIPENCFSAKESRRDLLEQAATGGQEALPGKLVVVGDSHAFANWPMVSFGREQGAFDLVAFGHDGCGPFDPIAGKSASCQKYLEKLPLIMQRELGRGDAILVSFFMPFNTAGPYPFADKFLRDLADVAGKAGAEVIIEAPLPRFGRPAYLCTREWFRSDYNNCEVKRGLFETNRMFLMSWLEILEKDYGDVIHIWDAEYFICDQDCQQFTEGKPVFRDSNHLSYFGARSLGPEFVRFLKVKKMQDTEVNILVPK